jgi:hypothetical protein
MAEEERERGFYPILNELFNFFFLFNFFNEAHLRVKSDIIFLQKCLFGMT